MPFVCHQMAKISPCRWAREQFDLETSEWQIVLVMITHETEVVPKSGIFPFMSYFHRKMIEHDDKPWDFHCYFQLSPFPFTHAALSGRASAKPKTKAPVVAHSKADVSLHANQLNTISSAPGKDPVDMLGTMTHDISWHVRKFDVPAFLLKIRSRWTIRHHSNKSSQLQSRETEKWRVVMWRD